MGVLLNVSEIVQRRPGAPFPRGLNCLKELEMRPRELMITVAFCHVDP